ncbi:MAG: glucose-6-phosphate dehydrogenase [SAR324 cluster bacterium]|nr:glucose-6-phosphate dehydrogenase [SAR324 cluster bacterium]
MQMNPLHEGLIQERVPEPHVRVIFGAGGDLSKRKLIPALYTLARERLLPGGFAMLGTANRDMDDKAFRQEMKESCDRFARRRPVDASLWKGFSNSLYYEQGNFGDPTFYQALKARLEAIRGKTGIPPNTLFYLSVPPSVFPMIVDNLRTAGLVTRGYSPWTRIIVEKPFGRDLESARTLNRELKQVFREMQIFRIDHYLGKETVQNMLALRFANGIFEPLWNSRYVSNVQITAAEPIGMEGRGSYFEEAGILRDMVQNHLFQVLCLTAMEPPVNIEAGAVRDEKVKLLHALRPIPPREMDKYVVRAHYQMGRVLGEAVPGYREEPGVAKNSITETFVALKLYIDNWRWGNVPFFLRTAKRMPKKVTEISILFRQAPHSMFGNNGGRPPAPNMLSIRIQPDEGISLHFGSKVPGPSMEIAPVSMEFRYGTSFGQEPPEAYERLILDAMLGDGTLFIRDDETEASWKFISQIHEVWKKQRKKSIPLYHAGTWGPEEANKLMSGTDMTWRNP